MERQEDRVSDEGPKQVVARIRAELEAARGSRIWPEYIRALNLISQVVFTRSAGFVLELVQNAEDAGKEGGEDRKSVV